MLLSFHRLERARTSEFLLWKAGLPAFCDLGRAPPIYLRARRRGAGAKKYPVDESARVFVLKKTYHILLQVLPPVVVPHHRLRVLMLRHYLHLPARDPVVERPRDDCPAQVVQREVTDARVEIVVFRAANCALCGMAPFDGYTVLISGNSKWAGTITGLQFAPTGSCQGGTNLNSIDIDYIRLTQTQ